MDFIQEPLDRLGSLEGHVKGLPELGEFRFELYHLSSQHRFRRCLQRRLGGLEWRYPGHLAALLRVDRWIAQRIAYCFRETGTVRQVGKQGNTRLYEFAEARKAG